MEAAQLFADDNPLSPNFKGPHHGKGSFKEVPKPDPLISGCKVNPFHSLHLSPTDVQSFTLQKTFRGHLMSVSKYVLSHSSSPTICYANFWTSKIRSLQISAEYCKTEFCSQFQLGFFWNHRSNNSECWEASRRFLAIVCGNSSDSWVAKSAV